MSSASFNTKVNNMTNQFGNFAQNTVELGQALNGLNSALQGMPQDHYNPTLTQPNPSGKVDTRTLFSNQSAYSYPNYIEQKFADRLSFFGIEDSQKFLGAADKPWKRSLMSVLGMGLGDNSRKYIRNKIDEWAGQADILRTGVSLNDARLMQLSGVRDSAHLASYQDPFNVHAASLYSTMGANAMQYGGIFKMPDIGSVTNAINNARLLPPEIIWT